MTIGIVDIAVAEARVNALRVHSPAAPELLVQPVRSALEPRRFPRFPEDAEDAHLIVTGQVGHLRRRPSRNRDSAQVVLARPATRNKSLRRASLALLGVKWSAVLRP